MIIFVILIFVILCLISFQLFYEISWPRIQKEKEEEDKMFKHYVKIVKENEKLWNTKT